MEKKKIAIIGGGMTGCTIAIYLAKKGHEVVLYERGKTLGGTVRDLVCNNNTYFKGPNYLKSDSFLVESIKKEEMFIGSLEKFNASPRSFTDIFGKESYSNNFAHPITTCRFTSRSKKILKFNSIQDRLSYYPSKINNNLKNWCSKFEHELNNLHQECCHPMGISRLHFIKDNKKIYIMKKKSKNADNLLGIPNPNYKTTECYLPNRGYNSFFNLLQNYLEKKKVKFNFGSKVIIKKERNNSTLFSGKEKIVADHFIWAANPVPLIKFLNLGILDNPITKVETISCNLKSNNNYIENNFIQVFSKQSNIFRIFLYNIANQSKVCIELFYSKKKNNLAQELKFAKKILNNFNYKLNFVEPVSVNKEIRHILFSVNDYKRFMNFEKISEKHNIIGGAWFVYGSDNKINYIKDQIDKRLQ